MLVFINFGTQWKVKLSLEEQLRNLLLVFSIKSTNSCHDGGNKFKRKLKLTFFVLAVGLEQLKRVLIALFATNCSQFLSRSSRG